MFLSGEKGPVRTEGMNIVTGIAKLVHGISGMFLDDSEYGRSQAIVALSQSPTLLNGIPWAQDKSGLVKAGAGIIPLDGKKMTAEEAAAMSAMYDLQKALYMNENIEELPFTGFESYPIRLTQSYTLTIPSNTSLVETTYCSPLMNLGEQFKKLSHEYMMYKVIAVKVSIDLQNQNYSTPIFGYDPILSQEDIQTMQNDLWNLSENPANAGNTATGHKLQYYYATLKVQNEEPGKVGPNGQKLEGTGKYTRALSDIKSLASSVQYGITEPAAMGMRGPSFRLISMRDDHVSNPVQQSPHKYLSFDGAHYFFEKNTGATDKEIYVAQMPVYGKFHFALSNTFTSNVDLITTVEYTIVCKRKKPASGYLPGSDATSKDDM